MRVAYHFMLEQPWLSLFFYPYKRDCSADYVEQTEYDSDSENIREYRGKNTDRFS